MRVDEVIKAARDDTGEEVVNVYARNAPWYAVYQTADRVRIHYADDVTLQKAQRAGIAQINPLRSEITGLIDGWRFSKNAVAVRRAHSYSLRLSDGLILALEGDIAGAMVVLAAIKQDIINEQTSKARFQYLTWACLAVIGFELVGSLALLLGSTSDTGNPLRSASAGAIGAFFSIAIGLRSRTILTDLHYRDNASDAVLRIVIGLIAAAFLMCCVESNITTFLLDGKAFKNAGDLQWLYVLIIGFAGGFSERLVPDMLAKSMNVAVADASALRAAAGAKASVAKSTAAGSAGGVAGSPVAEVAAAAPLSAANQNTPSGTGTAIDAEADHDGCLCHSAVTDDEATADAQLPPSIGGVAAPRS